MQKHEKMEQEIPYTLLAKHFAHQSSVAEAAEVMLWRSLLPQNEKIYTELLDEWNVVHADPSSFVIPNKDRVWNSITLQLNKTFDPILYTRKVLYKVAAIAASIALLTGISTTALFTSFLVHEEDALVAEHVFIVPTGQKSQLLLPDGTKVWMNAGSTLTYSTDFSRVQREVKLEGEAFFDVAHDDSHAFRVKAGSVDVLVHGTAFTVSNYTADPFISVALARGSVSVEDAFSHTLLAKLVPGEKADVSKAEATCMVSAFDAKSHNIWMLNQLQFKGEAVHDVFKKVERWYGVKIRVINEDPSYCYWFTLKTESLTETLNLINKITPVDYTINGEEVTIRYKR